MFLVGCCDWLFCRFICSVSVVAIMTLVDVDVGWMHGCALRFLPTTHSSPTCLPPTCCGAHSYTRTRYTATTCYHTPPPLLALLPTTAYPSCRLAFPPAGAFAVSLFCQCRYDACLRNTVLCWLYRPVPAAPCQLTLDNGSRPFVARQHHRFTVSVAACLIPHSPPPHHLPFPLRLVLMTVGATRS